jgi:hypothetical protein
MGVPPLYFLDEMEPYELKAIINESDNVFKSQCEDVRKIQHAICQSQNSKTLQLTDVQKFPWDESEVTNVPKRSKDEREKYALEMQNKLNNQ